MQLFGSTLPILDLTRGEFPLLTTRKMRPYGIFGELAAFLEGTTSLQRFKDLGCNYWDDNAAKWSRNAGLPKEQWSVGKIYGANWRCFGAHGVDQIDMLQESLVRDPYGRRHLLTTYDPSELDNGCLPPCHLLTQFNVRGGELDAIVYMRSVDLCLGLPTDVALYAALLIVLANSVGYKPGRIAFMMGDTHVYAKHMDTLQEQVLRVAGTPCTWQLDENATVDNFHPGMLKIINYVPQEALRYELFA